MSYLIGIDIGGTNLRAAVISEVGGALILDKKIINGAHSQTAEINNMIIN